MTDDLSGITLNLVSNLDEANQMMRWLGERRPCLAFDTETTGFDPYEPNAAIRLMQIGDAMTGWAVPAQMWGGVIIEALNKYEGPLVLHNSVFDLRWMKIHANWDAPYDRLHDTMIMGHLDDPTSSIALKSLSDRHISRKASAGQHLLKEAFDLNKWTWATVPTDFALYWQYGGLDTVLTARLFEKLSAHVRFPEAYELEMAVRRVCGQMEENGSPVDLDYCQKKYNELNDYAEQMKEWGKRVLKTSLSSNVQLARYFTGLDAEITEITAGGAPSVNKRQLRLFINELPGSEAAQVAQVVLNMRKADKLANTYFLNFLTKNRNGVLHPSINTLGARTARMSIRQPALQTLPKGESTVRNAFIPHPGQKLISSDYAAVEMRLMAHFSRDPMLIKAFIDVDAVAAIDPKSPGADFFSALGAQIYGDPGFDKSNPRRGLVKNTLYGAAYGAGVSKMAETAGVSIDQMRSVSDAVFATYPGIKRFQAEIEDVGMRRQTEEGRGYVITPIGRKLPCDDGRVYALVNYLLQSTAADILKRAIVNLDLAGYGKNMLLPVHDEIVASVDEADVKEAMHDIGQLMSNMTDYAVPITAEPEGPFDRWGAKYEKPVVNESTDVDFELLAKA